ncbi:transposase [Maioricimonas rarisocia]|uniref:transposase n=1 Tax=Maioricimonas rarisocia TaxID=2528026 RepID=UPI0011A420E4
MNSPASRRAYPSDVSDRQWTEIAELLAPESPGGRHRTIDLREVVNALSYRWQTGCVWRMLPHDFPAWASVYWYVRRWRRDGTLRSIREILLRRQRLRKASRTTRDGMTVRECFRPALEDCRSPSRHPGASVAARNSEDDGRRQRPQLRTGRPAASRADSGSRCSG